MHHPVNDPAAALLASGDDPETSGRRLRVAFCPPTSVDNPYQQLLVAALAERGVDVEFAARLDLASARRLRRRVDAVHVHWIEHAVYHRVGRIRSRVLTRWNALQYAAALLVLSRSGCRLVWTVHNLRAHESRFPRLEGALARLTLRLADRVVVHSRFAAGRLEQQLGPSPNVVVGPHGHYGDSYERDSRPRTAIRRELGLPEDAFVFLIFGSLRGYKCVPETIRAFTELDDPDVRLVVTGRAKNAAIERAIQEAAEVDPRVDVRLGFVDAGAVGTWHAAADAAVLNYAEVFSSGALLLALTYGLPVVAPAPSTAEEVAGEALVPIRNGDVRDALERALRADQPALRAAAESAAAAAGWLEMARILVEAYARDDAARTLAA
jgi:beta-1,4-mannosyltransferase